MGSKALLKALKALETFQATEESLSVKEIANLVDETESSAQRSAYTLEALGYLERDLDGKRLIPGRSCLRPVYGYLRHNRFLEAATPYLIDLAERFSTRTDLTVLDGTQIINLSRIPSRDELLNLSPLGRRWPAVNTASGRAILAASPPDVLTNVLQNSTLTKITPNTLTDHEQIRAAVHDASINGYAFQSGEVLLSAASVGAAVTGMGGKVHGAIVIGGPVKAFEDIEQRQMFGQAVVNAALAIGAHNLV